MLNIEAVKQAIGIPDFKRTELLEIALTHPSHTYEKRHLTQQQKELQEREYRRLAILGDAILGAVVIDYLHQQYPDLNQGRLTNLKSNLVSQKRLAEFARELNLRQLCLLGQGVEQKDYTEERLFTEMFEALLGAIYLERERDFLWFRNWLVEGFIEKAVKNLLTDTPITKNQLLEDTVQEVSMMNSNEVAEKLRQMNQEADALVAEDEKLQQLLTWINKKSLSVEPYYKPAKVRAFYLALVRLLGLAFVRNFDPTRSGAKARQFALSFNRAREVALDLAFNHNSNLDPANVLVCVFALDVEPELKQALQRLQAELPDPKADREGFEAWRQANGQAWFEEIRNLLGHDLQLSDAQKDLLKQYYDANKLLVECLNSARQVSEAVRQEIEETLLLPVELIG
jgi:dsRNA-specific ribonuclease